eukprot:SAG22_NODE_473_length_10069_cov_17.183250_5_plen_303_part_00
MPSVDAISAAKHLAEQAEQARDEQASTRARVVEMARVCQAVERWDEMLESARQFKDFGGALTSEERNLLQTAYKAKVAPRLKSLQIVRGIAGSAVQDDNMLSAECAGEYCTLLEQEVTTLCEEVLATVQDLVLPLRKETDGAARIFFHKMVGDFHRYLADARSSGAEREAAKQAAKAAYSAAATAAATEGNLGVCHPTRLALGLNMAVFEYEVLGETASGLETASAVLTAAIDQLDELAEEDYAQCTRTLSRLQAVLEKWTSGRWSEERLGSTMPQDEGGVSPGGVGAGFVDHARRAEYGVS